jgi:diadenosine tetraphosphatase ApaH/serine/threonine PP2A family protein phosphatase
MAITRIGIIADIHANLWALEAVLSDASRRGITDFVDLGDVLYGPLEPLRTYERLRTVNLLAGVQGNQDRLIYNASADTLTTNPTLAFVVDELGAEPIEWLRQLPKTAVFEDDLFLFHGTPASDVTYLLEDVSSGRPLLHASAEIKRLLGDVRQPVALCGHTHIPRLVQLPHGPLILNPGSVGLPAYDDDKPVPHFMETYSPHAQYAILEKRPTGWDVSFHRVAYDHGAAAAAARKLNREDWARGIEAGRMT